MCSLFRWSSGSAALLALGMTASAFIPIVTSAPASAQATAPASPGPTSGAAATFPDVGRDYWARPFIQALAQRNVITGFADGTFRPDEPVDRAEFAAMIQKAFNQKPVRDISAGAFTDVPPDYWAASAIEEAYETGFMGGYPGTLFLPDQEIPKVQAIVALTKGLGLASSGSASDIVRTYYIDAGLIPTYAVNNVAAATQANIVVSYPNVRVLNPLMPLTRAEAAAHLYQALLRLGQVKPLASSEVAANYIVRRTTDDAQNTQSVQPSPRTTLSNIVDLAASSSSFTTLTSALKATGLAESLQKQGPFTVFAPTDRAFAALTKGSLNRLLLPENRETLTRILMYHLIRGKLTARELQSREVKTVEGSPVNVKVNSATNQVRVNNASVIQPNMQASNGVIHAVNEVLLPPNFDLSQLQ